MLSHPSTLKKAPLSAETLDLNTAFTLEEVLQAVLLADFVNKDTFFNHVFVLTRDDNTVLRKLFVVR